MEKKLWRLLGNYSNKKGNVMFATKISRN